MYPFQRDPEEFFRRIRDVVRGIGGRVVVFVRIDPEYGEVPCMARPYPVVGVPSEFPHRRRRSAHQPYVAVLPVQEEEILVAVIQGFDGGPQSFALRCGLFYECPGVGFHHGIPLLLGHVCGVSVQDPACDVLHPFQETHGQALVRQLLIPAHRPEPVPEVVVLYTAVLLYLSVAAVVVGEQKAFRRDHLPCTPPAEQHYGVFQ